MLLMSPWSELYIDIVMLPEEVERAYRIYIERTPTNVHCTDATRSWTTPKLGCQRQVRRPQHFSCQASLQLSCTRRIKYWKHLLKFYSIFEVISQLSHTCVKAFSRGAMYRAGNFHRWNAAHMHNDITNTCVSQSISATVVDRVIHVQTVTVYVIG